MGSRRSGGRRNKEKARQIALTMGWSTGKQCFNGNERKRKDGQLTLTAAISSSGSLHRPKWSNKAQRILIHQGRKEQTVGVGNYYSLIRHFIHLQSTSISLLNHMVVHYQRPSTRNRPEFCTPTEPPICWITSADAEILLVKIFRK